MALEKEIQVKLQAWRNTLKTPAEAPHVYLSIGPSGHGRGITPWVLSLEAAREILGPVVDAINEEPVEVTISLAFVEKST